MAIRSTPGFSVVHALRVTGFASLASLSDATGLGAPLVDGELASLASDGLVSFREARQVWQLTADGRAAHAEMLAAELDGHDPADLHASYRTFLVLDAEFKRLCGDWQLRDGAINDHSDAAYDREVVTRLGSLHTAVEPVVAEIGGRIERFERYGARLEVAFGRVTAGESNMFTGVMCGSYHDVWMELHEDLIVTLGVDRAAEGGL